ncbi:hypothetical protein ACFL5S_01125 [Fibrobacterota bacterium]
MDKPFNTQPSELQNLITTISPKVKTFSKESLIKSIQEFPLPECKPEDIDFEVTKKGVRIEINIPRSNATEQLIWSIKVKK